MELTRREKISLWAIFVLVMLAIVIRLFNVSLPKSELVVVRPMISSSSEAIFENQPATSSPAENSYLSSSTEPIISAPLANAFFAAPYGVEGRAPGSWFFEGQLPLSLVDSVGNILATGQGYSSGDWMTEQMVYFRGNLTMLATSSSVDVATATPAYLVVHKDNPSGLPENDGSYKIPVLISK